MKNLKLFIFLSFCFICNSSNILAQSQGASSGWTAYNPGASYFFITNIGNEKVLDVAGSGTQVGTNVGVWGKHEGNNQKFKFVSKGDGYYAIETALKKDIYLSIHNSGKTDNTNIKLNNPVGQQQHFKVEKNAKEEVRFISKLGNDLYIGTDDNGGNIALRKGEKGNKTLFSLTATDVANLPSTTSGNTPEWTAYNPGASYFLITNIDNEKVLDVPGSATEVGTGIGLWGKHEGDNQKFKFISKGNGYYAIETALKKDSYLSIHNSGKTDNTNIKLNNPVGEQQHFKVEKNAKGEVRFVSKLGNDLYLGTDDKGSKLVLRKGAKGNKTLFNLKSTNASLPNPIANTNNSSNTGGNSSSGKITFKNTASTLAVTVSKIGDNDFEQTIGPSMSIQVNSKPGEVFMFATSSEGFEAFPFTVIKTGVTHNIIVGPRYNSGKGNKLPNTKASRYSFDIKKVDPIYIDYTGSQSIKSKKGKVIGKGGMRKEIFKPLTNEDIDWYNGDGDYAMKNHFSYEKLSEGEKDDETFSFYSASAYEESFSANVGADTPKGGGSASFSHTSSESDEETNIYSYSRVMVKAYRVSLKEKEFALPSLTDDFKKAIMALPKSYNKVNYFNFIKSWGTHYPRSTTYGGCQVAAYKFNAREMMQSESMAVGVEGNVKAVSAGGGYSNDEEFNQQEENSQGMYRSKGGSGTGDDFAVDMDSSVPVEIDLKRLHLLLTTAIFNDGTSSSELSARKSNLKKAITEYIGSPIDKGSSLKPRMYKISNVKWQATKGESDFQVYGKVWISIYKEGVKDALAEKTVWSRSDAGGSRVVAKTNHKSSCYGEIIYTIIPKDGAMDLDKYYIKLSSSLSDWNSGSSNEAGGYKKETITCDEIPRRPKQLYNNVSFPREETKIKVSADVEEVDLGFDD